MLHTNGITFFVYMCLCRIFFKSDIYIHFHITFKWFYAKCSRTKEVQCFSLCIFGSLNLMEKINAKKDDFGEKLPWNHNFLLGTLKFVDINWENITLFATLFSIENGVEYQPQLYRRENTEVMLFYTKVVVWACRLVTLLCTHIYTHIYINGT